jgi:hypothetical protein
MTLFTNSVKEKSKAKKRMPRKGNLDNSFEILDDKFLLVGKARYVTKQEAIEILGKYRENPLVVSVISGKPMELCRTWPERCLYWRLEKHGISCLDKASDR